MRVYGSRAACRAAPGIHLCIGAGRCAFDHHGGIAAQFVDLGFADHALENVEAVLPVRRQNVGVQAVIRIKAHGATVIEFARETQALRLIGGHAFGVFGAREFARVLNIGVGDGIHDASSREWPGEILAQKRRQGKTVHNAGIRLGKPAGVRTW